MVLLVVGVVAAATVIVRAPATVTVVVACLRRPFGGVCLSH